MSTYHEMIQNKNLNPQSCFHLDQFHSVEFSVKNVNFLYQFKIWKTPELPFFVIVKKSSHIVKLIKTGDVLNLRYYADDATLPTKLFPTKILDIHWQDHGRFSGHYIISLGVADSAIKPDNDGTQNRPGCQTDAVRPAVESDTNFNYRPLRSRCATASM